MGIYSYDGSFEIEDQTRVLDGVASTFQVTPLVLQPPPAPALKFIYSATLANGDPLPPGLITFDSGKIEFTVESSDQALVGEYNIKVDATSVDERWTGQTVSVSFKLTAEPKPAADSDYEVIRNFPPEFEKVGIHDSFPVSFTEDTEIELGPTIDTEGDKVKIKYDDKGHSFITFDEKALSLKVEKYSPIGSWNVTFVLTDDSGDDKEEDKDKNDEDESTTSNKNT